MDETLRKHDRGFMAAVALAVACVAVLLWAAGCSLTLSNQGEVGLRYGTEVTFFHRAAKTADEAAESRLEAPALIDWLIGLRDEGGGPPAPPTTGS